jgi:multidrug efflux pump subunit AcrA (membrane-fusion protein)
MNAARAVSLLLAAGMLLGGCAHGRNGRAQRVRPTSPPIPTVQVKHGTVRATSTISGVIAPFQNVMLSSSLTEPADSVSVNEGDRVRAGQVLAVLDTADLRANLDQARSTVETDLRNAASADAKVSAVQYQGELAIEQGHDQVQAARAALAQAQHTLAQASQDLDRDRRLLANGYVAQQQFDQQQTTAAVDAAQVRSAEANLQTALTNARVNGTSDQGLQAAGIAAAQADALAAHATVDQARAQVAQYQAQIDKATIVSPVDGILVNRNLNPGEYPAGRTLFVVQQLDHVYAELNASSADTFAIPSGAPVTISAAGSVAAYHGKVVAVLGQVTPGSTNFAVKIDIANPGLKLVSGLPVTASIALPAVSGLAIPTKAFLDDTHASVMLADDELTETIAKTIHVRELASDGTTSIVSGNLKQGDSVVANGQLGLTDGQTIAEQ